MGKHYILVRNKRKSQRTIIHAPRCAFPETSINKGQLGRTKFYSTLAEIFRESYRVYACSSVATPHQREEWTHQPRGAMVTDT